MVAAGPRSQGATIAQTGVLWDLAVNTGHLLTRIPENFDTRFPRNRLRRETPAGSFVLLPDRPDSYDDFGTSRLNADGTVVMGFATPLYSFAPRLFRWTASNGVMALVSLPSDVRIETLLLSGDGNTLAGRLMIPDCCNNPTMAGYRWTPTQGLEVLTNYSEILALSADAKVLLARSATSNAVVRVTATTGASPLGPLPFPANAPQLIPTSLLMTADGETVFGTANSPTPTLYRWRLSDGHWTEVGEISGSTNLGLAAVSADGQTVLGRSAWIWREGPGTQSLTNYLASLALDLSAYTILTADQLSANGRVLAGTALVASKPFSTPITVGWIVRLDEVSKVPIEVPSQTHRVLGIEITTRLDNEYRVQLSSNLQSWSDAEPPLFGDGAIHQFWFTIGSAPFEGFRLLEIP